MTEALRDTLRGLSIRRSVTVSIMGPSGCDALVTIGKPSAPPVETDDWHQANAAAGAQSDFWAHMLLRRWRPIDSES